MDKNELTWSYLGLAGGIVTLVGCFLPFIGSISLFQPTQMYSVIGIIMAAGIDTVMSGEGFVMVVPLLAGILSVILNLMPFSRVSLIVAIVCAVPWLLFAAMISSSIVSIGIGFWVMTIGMALSVIAPIVDILKQRS